MASENVAVTSLDPVSVGWNGNALLVYDDGSVDFYGGQQQDLPTTPVKAAASVPVAGVSEV